MVIANISGAIKRINDIVYKVKSQSISAAAYRVIEDIEKYNRIGGLQNEISRLATQIYILNEMSAPRNKAIMALLKLQAYGVFTGIKALNPV